MVPYWKESEMPNWARLKTTRNAPLGDRMASVFENGYGDEGPMAKGCCLFLFLGVMGILSIPAIALIWFMFHLFS
jgi:hypothetical protein